MNRDKLIAAIRRGYEALGWSEQQIAWKMREIRSYTDWRLRQHRRMVQKAVDRGEQI